ncbi:MAG: hypothetical protein ACO3B3_10340 [Cyanobium sp.]
MPDLFPSTGPMPSRQGHAPSLSTGAAAAQQGMVRIHRGAEVRYVWPVHVAGWLSSGWRIGEVEPRPQAAAAQVISQRPGQDAQLPVPAGSPSSAPEPPAAPATTVDEPVGEPIDAHLPTNLLDLDLEPVAPAPEPTSATTPAAPPAEAPQQKGIDLDDAEPASFAAPGQAEVDAEGTAAAASEEPAPPEATEPPQEEPTPPPAPARRGRPRKVRPETQAEPTAEPVAEPTSEQQPSASADVTEPQEQALVLTSEGDDPFGLDPLL